MAKNLLVAATANSWSKLVSDNLKNVYSFFGYTFFLQKNVIFAYHYQQLIPYLTIS